MKYMLTFETPVRLGSEVAEAIGPFDSTTEALEYYNNEVLKWKLPAPNCSLMSIMSKET